jgi:hypothetical protein
MIGLKNTALKMKHVISKVSVSGEEITGTKARKLKHFPGLEL